MVSRLQQFYDWLHTHEGRKIFRYSMVSVISTAVSLIVIVIVYGVYHLWSEIPSTVFGNVVAIFPSYWLNRKWAWGKHGRSHFMKEVVPFWIMAAFGIAFSIVGAVAGPPCRPSSTSWTTSRRPWSCWPPTCCRSPSSGCSSSWSFNRLFHHELEEFDEHLTHEEEDESVEVSPH